MVLPKKKAGAVAAGSKLPANVSLNVSTGSNAYPLFEVMKKEQLREVLHFSRGGRAIPRGGSSFHFLTGHR